MMQTRAAIPALITRIVPMMLLVALVSACALPKKPVAVPPPVTKPAPPAPPPYEAPADLSPKERLLRVIRLLESGNQKHARVDLLAYLHGSPNSRLGKSLLEQMDTDPVLLLGAEHYDYEVKASESLSQLAERFLNDRYKFWALARYNGITDPMLLTQGRTIKVPGVPKPQAEPEKVTAADDEEVARRLEEEIAEKKEPPKPPEPAKPLRIVDPVKAMALRKLGLENMQRGKIDAAIALFNDAVELAFGTPSLAIIQKDLARALRLKQRLR